MAARIIFVTGTDTAVGKTVVAALMTRKLRACGFRTVAIKPICSGGRDDAILLREACGRALDLDLINPWYFSEPIAPVLAARREGCSILAKDVLRHVRAVVRTFGVVVVEGAGGLLSPLGEDFDCRDLLLQLRATPVVVASNKLGAVNQVRLVLEALPPSIRRSAATVLVGSREQDASHESNMELLAEFVPEQRLFFLPWLAKLSGGKPDAKVRRMMDRLIRSLALANRPANT